MFKLRALKCFKTLAIALVILGSGWSVGNLAAQVYTSYSALDGSVSAPAFAFNSATNTGLSRDSVSGAAQMSVAGTLAQRWLSGGPVVAGQLRSNSSKPPTVNGSNTIVGTDTAMIITAVGSPASIVVTFASTWAAAPACIYTNATTATSATAKVTTTTTTATLVPAGYTGAAANFGTDTIGLLCIGG